MTACETPPGPIGATPPGRGRGRARVRPKPHTHPKRPRSASLAARCCASPRWRRRNDAGVRVAGPWRLVLSDHSRIPGRPGGADGPGAVVADFCNESRGARTSACGVSCPAPRHWRRGGNAFRPPRAACRDTCVLPIHRDEPCLTPAPPCSAIIQTDRHHAPGRRCDPACSAGPRATPTARGGGRTVDAGGPSPIVRNTGAPGPRQAGRPRREAGPNPPRTDDNMPGRARWGTRCRGGAIAKTAVAARRDRVHRPRCPAWLRVLLADITSATPFQTGTADAQRVSSSQRVHARTPRHKPPCAVLRRAST